LRALAAHAGAELCQVALVLRLPADGSDGTKLKTQKKILRNTVHV
jgi:hypothetical protein